MNISAFHFGGCQHETSCIARDQCYTLCLVKRPVENSLNCESRAINLNDEKYVDFNVVYIYMQLLYTQNHGDFLRRLGPRQLLTFIITQSQVSKLGAFIRNIINYLCL